jgi:hypothetical protein
MPGCFVDVSFYAASFRSSVVRADLEVHPRSIPGQSQGRTVRCAFPHQCEAEQALAHTERTLSGTTKTAHGVRQSLG